jgi:flavin-dependent dehydrogenase
VVDASGRNSKAPEWLAAMGFPIPHESMVDAHPGYASRVYRRPADFNESWEVMYIMPEAPDQPRGAVILPMEGDRWHVTLIGFDGDYPPTDEEGFLAFARSLPSPRVYDVLSKAEPLTAPVGYRKAENRLRQYDKLLRYLDGFLLCGDSVYALNPVYGQGMSVAAIGAEALDRVIAQHRQKHGDGNLIGLAATFQKELGKVIAGPWQMATGQDRRWRGVEGAGELDAMTRLIQSYFDKVMRVMLHDAQVAEAFLYVLQMVAEPSLLFRPDILVRVMVGSWKRRSPAKVDAPKPVAVAQ